MGYKDIRDVLISCGLKVTPQRVAVMKAFSGYHEHPTAEKIIELVRVNHPSISNATVYKTLETLVAKGVLRKVKTDRGIMRYDPIVEDHHHLYCAESDRIEDYFDDDLDNILDNYFKSRNIPGFRIEDIKLQIIGRFLKKDSN